MSVGMKGSPYAHTSCCWTILTIGGYFSASARSSARFAPATGARTSAASASEPRKEEPGEAGHRAHSRVTCGRGWRRLGAVIAIVPDRDELAQHGVVVRGHVFWRPTTSQLYEHALARGDARLAEGGPLVVDTGVHTGRSPKDKFVVREPGSESRIWWSEVNKPISRGALRAAARQGRGAPRRGGRLRRRRVRRRRSGAPHRRARDLRECVARAVREDPLHRPHRGGARGHGAAGPRPPRARVEADARRGRHEQRDLRLLHPSRVEVVIGGTWYAGEIKKSIFTRHERPAPSRGRPPDALLGERRRRRPRRGLLRPVGHREDDALRRPGAAPDRRRRARLGRRRRLQHRGRLLREGDPPLAEAEPEIYATTRTFGTVLENVVVDERGVLDLDDDSKTENTRAAYKLEQIANALPAKRAGHPSSVVFLTADAFGILPPIARLSREPGDVLVPLRVHGEARGHRDRRRRAAADVLGLLRRAVPAAAAVRVRAAARREARHPRTFASGSSTRGGPAGRSARAGACRSPRRGRCSTRRSR